MISIIIELRSNESIIDITSGVWFYRYRNHGWLVLSLSNASNDMFFLVSNLELVWLRTDLSLAPNAKFNLSAQILSIYTEVLIVKLIKVSYLVSCSIEHQYQKRFVFVFVDQKKSGTNFQIVLWKIVVWPKNTTQIKEEHMRSAMLFGTLWQIKA